MKKQAYLSALAILLIAVGCDSGHGPDSLFAPRTGSAASLGCVKCHNATSSIAPDPLLSNGTGTQGSHVRHVQNLGLPCERCHTSYETMATHMNGVLNTADPATLIVYFDAINSGGSWTNDTGAGTGRCSGLACHGTGTPNWYASGWVLPPCTECHFQSIGLRRPVTGTLGDFASNPGISSHHVTGGVDPVNGQCLVCHNLSTHATGTVLLRQADTDAVIVYSAASPTTLEPFCLSCHDTTGAAITFVTGGTPTSPFSDGSTLGVAPYSYAMRIAGSWAKSFGHGPNGNHGEAGKLTCLGTVQPGTGCHGSNGAINAHGSAYQVLAARNFNYAIGGRYNAADYDLCFTCHSSYPGFTKEDVLAVKFGGILDSDYGMLTGPSGTSRKPPYYTDQYGFPKGLTTRFADHNDGTNPLNDVGFWGTPNRNLHWFHLGLPVASLRGTGASSRLVCVNCHDVHGASNPYGATYDEMGYLHVAPDGTNLIGVMNNTAYSTSLLKSYPFYCAFNCHFVQRSTRAWYYPIVE
jgi:hypothetical protein